MAKLVVPGADPGGVASAHETRKKRGATHQVPRAWPLPNGNALWRPKIAFKKYFLREAETRPVAPIQEKHVLGTPGIEVLKK